MNYLFSSPTGAYLISIGEHYVKTIDIYAFSSPTGAYLISMQTKVVIPPNKRFSSPTGAYLISIPSSTSP